MNSCVCPPGSSRTVCRSQILSSRLRPMGNGAYPGALSLRDELVRAGRAIAFSVRLRQREVVLLQIPDVLEAGLGEQLLELLRRDVASVRDVLGRRAAVDAEHLSAALEQRREHLAFVAHLEDFALDRALDLSPLTVRLGLQHRQRTEAVEREHTRRLHAAADVAQEESLL